MSIYWCIDRLAFLLDTENKKKTKKPLAMGFNHAFLGFYSTSQFVSLTQDEQQFFQVLGNKLQEIRNQFENEIPEEQVNRDIQVVIEQIKLQLVKTTQITIRFTLLGIMSDLQAIIYGVLSKSTGNAQYSAPDPYSEKLTAEMAHLFNSPCVKQRFCQGRIKQLGNSKGECYGFTFSMVDPLLSIYHTNHSIIFNERVYNYQKNSMIRNKDQGIIKRTRLTRKHFCSSLDEQATLFYKAALHHKEEDLAIHLQSAHGGHAVYLSMQADGKIRYMDCNYGAFLFENKEEFIAGYKLLYLYQKKHHPAAYDYNFYEINKLTYDPHNQHKESHGVSGKWRSFLTGTKYLGKGALIAETTVVLVGVGLGGAMGAAIGSAIPIIGTIIGFALGALLGGALAYAAQQVAQAAGHYGVMGLFHYCRAKLHFYCQSRKNKFVKPSCEDIPAFPGVEPISASTVGMLTTLGTATNASELLPNSSATTPSTPVLQAPTPTPIKQDITHITQHRPC